MALFHFVKRFPVWLLVCIVPVLTNCADVLANLLEGETELFTDYTHGLDRSAFAYDCAISNSQRAELGLDGEDDNLGIEIYRRNDGAVLYYTVANVHPYAIRKVPDVPFKNPHIVARTYYSGPGADGTWFTSDDAKAGEIIVPDEGDFAAKDFYSPGPDEIYFTEDDYLPDGYRALTIDSDGKLVKEISYEGDGSDGDWFTDDDDIISFRRYEYYANGLLQKDLFVNAGTDMDYDTTDDTFSVDEYEYSNDLQTALIEYTVDEFGSESTKTETNTSYAANGDVEGDTASLSDYEYQYGDDGLANFQRRIIYTDSMEDTVDYYEDTHYLDDFRIFFKSSIRYTDPGDDTVWFTDDDVPNFTTFGQVEVVPLYGDDGRLLRMAVVFTTDKGADGIWNTEDDTYQATNDGFVTFGEDDTYVGFYVSIVNDVYYLLLYNKQTSRIDYSSFVYFGEDALAGGGDDYLIYTADYGCSGRASQEDVR